jgi:predicted ribosome quality control (RQC) complex YloA/Tae2 family protein
VNILLLKAWLKDNGPGLIGSKAVAFHTYPGSAAGIELRGEQSGILLFRVDPRQPVIALATEQPAVEPSEQQSNFVKALKFHLAGYRLESIRQEGFDRSAVFSFGYRDQYGQYTQKELRIELAGSAANAYLLSERSMVVSIMRRRRGEPGGTRTVVTGKPLPPPPPLGKFVAQQDGQAGLEQLLTEAAGQGGLFEDLDLGEFFVRHVAGCDKRVWPGLEPLLPVDYSISSLHEFIERFQRGAFNNELFELSPENSANRIALAQFSSRTASPAAAVTRGRAADAGGKQDQLRQHLALARRADEVEELAAQMMQEAAITESDAKAILTEWQADNPDWADQVDPALELEQNALKLSRYAQRLRRGEAKLEALLRKAEQGQPAGSSTRRTEQSAEVQRRRAAFARLEQKGIRHSRYRTTDGIDMVVGANAVSNDALLRVLGSGNHLWFHARDFAGSHVYLLLAGSDAPHASIRQAAITAAWFSQGRKEDRVEVSFTPVKQIRRPRNAKPGQVLIHSESVIMVRPGLFKELKPQLAHEG